ncbi:hypothetical protein EYM_07675 [Ignicoccus islandicus DSM 13165]|uniref:Uncharacterized protein n=1 Tax=Ignicoccus islandicus DSM 13165 TaxID=940295 RepID=A0A0U3EEB9_9CREN|nr:hypothetical protein [Ignicoccus islandicus]ALU12803.1 hypothetical protein EYM_07675 [Ignicoccus islandicus DSM 13165]
MSNVCWSCGTFYKKFNTLFEALQEIRSAGLSGRLNVKWPPLDILITDGVAIAFKGDLAAFSIPSKIEITFIKMSSEELFIEMMDPDYIKLESPESLLTLVKEIRVREALVLNGTVIPVVQLFEPSSVSVDTDNWGSMLLDVPDPPSELRELLGSEEDVAYNIVSVNDRWILDVVKCNKTIIGASLTMPEQVGAIYGVDAFQYPLGSSGKWIVTFSKPTYCAPINFVIDENLINKAREVVTGVIKI